MYIVHPPAIIPQYFLTYQPMALLKQQYTTVDSLYSIPQRKMGIYQSKKNGIIKENTFLRGRFQKIHCGGLGV